MTKADRPTETRKAGRNTREYTDLFIPYLTGRPMRPVLFISKAFLSMIFLSDG